VRRRFSHQYGSYRPLTIGQPTSKPHSRRLPLTTPVGSPLSIARKAHGGLPILGITKAGNGEIVFPSGFSDDVRAGRRKVGSGEDGDEGETEAQKLVSKLLKRQSEGSSGMGKAGMIASSLTHAPTLNLPSHAVDNTGSTTYSNGDGRSAAAAPRLIYSTPLPSQLLSCLPITSVSPPMSIPASEKGESLACSSSHLNVNSFLAMGKPKSREELRDLFNVMVEKGSPKARKAMEISRSYDRAREVVPEGAGEVSLGDENSPPPSPNGKISSTRMHRAHACSPSLAACEPAAGVEQVDSPAMGDSLRMRGPFQSPRGKGRTARQLKRASLVKPFALPNGSPASPRVREEMKAGGSGGEIRMKDGVEFVNEDENFEGVLEVDEFGVYLQFA
jgi:hypothetical protein